jgi:ATP-dependent Clp protease ATP-binding subunit ClpB
MTAAISNLTDDTVKHAFHIAQQIAKENIHAGFSAPHLLKALLHKDIGLLPLLKSLDKDHFYIEEWAEVRLESFPKSVPTGEPLADDMVTAILNEADDLRLKFNKDLVDAKLLLAAIVTPGVAFSFEQLKTLPLQRSELIDREIQNTDFANMVDSATGDSSVQKSSGNALLKYCIEKTSKEYLAKKDTIIGRDKEIRMMAEILCRRTKPNVMLIGEPGVGKTSLADGFAQAIAEKNVPDMLLHAKIYELDNGALIAGASYKGEIEDRLKQIFSAISKGEKIILFIDEIHSLIDKHGNAAGASAMLKPELAKGNITVIGATTLEEYKKHIENDEALNRRFEIIKVEEPDAGVAFQMLKNSVPYYEKHHNIVCKDEVIHESIRLAKRYIKDRKLPDAAIDLIDRTMAALRLMNDTGLKEIEQTEQTVEEWKKPDAEKKAELSDWKWLTRSFLEKISPVLAGKLSSETNAQELATDKEVINYLTNSLAELKKQIAQPRNEVEKTDLATIVAAKTGIPVGKLQSQEQDRLMNMEQILKQRVVGQDYAIKSIADAIMESRSGLGKPGQPIGSFFFLGPTGTGKTELAKSLAEFLFQDESLMIRFDMSEFKEEHSAALLYGAPPGYVGYEEGGMLVNKIRRQPYAVVLFDEIEKGHSSVFDVFLQIMDEGRLHDKLGKEGDFSNAVVIFTSNIGSQFVVDSFNKGEIPASNKLMEIMSNHFRPEFLGRLTEIVPFAPMKQEVVRGILDIQLKSLNAALEKQGIRLNISNAAKDKLATMGFTPAYGARPLAGIIRTELRRPLSKKIIEGSVKPGASIELTCNEKGEFEWNVSDKKNKKNN